MSNEIMYEIINNERVVVSDARKAQIKAEEAITIAISNSYINKRVAEYPPIGDQLDALWKGGAEAEAMLAKVQAVKAKYPKGAA
jgi:hypothetical protein